MEKRKIHYHVNYFPSNHSRIKFFSKKLISRNFCDKTVAAKFRNYHTVSAQCEKLKYLVRCQSSKNISSN